MKIPLFAKTCALLCAITAATISLSHAATITVINNNDSGAGSLRQAVADAASGDTINFDPSVTGTINLTSGEILIDNKSLTIQGPGASMLTLSSNGVSRVFLIGAHSGSSVSTLSISGFTMTNGVADTYPFSGGALQNYAWYNATLSDCVMTGNSAGDGGAISVIFDSIILNNCVITGNSSTGTGGGIATGFSSANSFGINNCTISNNTAAGVGGGISNGPGCVMTITNSTISGNTGSSGGGVWQTGDTVTLSNCTISGNQTTDGGAQGIASGIGFHRGSAALTACTISGNSGPSANDAGAFNDGGGNAPTVANTIIAGNISAGTPLDVNGAFVSNGYNFIGANGGPTGFVNGVNNDQVGTVSSPIDPLLGPLQDNGGPTFTMALLTGSPAIDQGNSFGLTTDQRGMTRPVDIPSIPNAGDGSDIGAFEVAFQQNPPLTLTDSVSRLVHGSAGTFDIELPQDGSGVECRDTGGNYTLVFTFSNGVVSGDASLNAPLGGSISGDPVISGNTITVQLTGVTDVQSVLVTLSNVTDIYDQVLPDTDVPANFLIGDVNGDFRVNRRDLQAGKMFVHQIVTQANFRIDTNVDGVIDHPDSDIIMANHGHRFQ